MGSVRAKKNNTGSTIPIKWALFLDLLKILNAITEVIVNVKDKHPETYNFMKTYIKVQITLKQPKEITIVVRFFFKTLSSELSVGDSPILLALYNKTPNIKCEAGSLGKAFYL